MPADGLEKQRWQNEDRLRYHRPPQDKTSNSDLLATHEIGRQCTNVPMYQIFRQHMKLDAKCWIPLQIDYLDPRDWSQELSVNEGTHERFCHEKMYICFNLL